MIIILYLFAGLFAVGYLLYWLRRSEASQGPDLTDEVAALRDEIGDLQRRIVTLEAIIASEASEPLIRDVEPTSEARSGLKRDRTR